MGNWIRLGLETGILVGILSLAAQMGAYANRQENLEQRQDRQRDAILQSQENDRILIDRMARVETKIDIILDNTKRANQ